MTGTTILNAIIEILVGGIVGIGEGIGSGLSSLASAIFLTAEGALSTFGTLIIVFGAISLGLSLCYLVFNWLTSWGK